MRGIALIAGAGILVATFLQCCPSAGPEAPGVQPPAEVTPVAVRLTPTPEAVGLSHDNPVPVGHTLTALNGALITVHGVAARGDEARRLVEGWAAFNPGPSEGKEFVIISASVAYEGGREETLRVSRHDFRGVLGGVIIDQPLLLTGDEMLEGEMFQGASIDGYVVFEVPEGSTGIVLIYTVPMQRSYYFGTE